GMAERLGVVTTQQAESMRLRVIDQFGDAVSATPFLDPPPPFMATFIPDAIAGEDDGGVNVFTHPAAAPYCGPVAKDNVFADYASDPNADTVSASLGELDAQAAAEDEANPTPSPWDMR